MSSVHRNVQQELGHVTCTKHLVNRSESGGSLVRTKVWGEDTPTNALPSQKLAGSTGSHRLIGGRRDLFRRRGRSALAGGLSSGFGDAIEWLWEVVIGH